MADASGNGNNGAVNRDLWENELELNIDEALLRAQDAEEMKGWVQSRTGRQADVLCRAMGIADATRLKDRRAALAQCNGQLTPYYLIDEFAHRKGEFAVADLAAEKLPDRLINLCRGEDAEAFDKRALLYALFHTNPEHLKTLFHLDKIHKSGFARMTLKQKVRQPEKKFADFLTTPLARELLDAFDQKKRDRRQSKLKDIIRHHHHHLVFIRRPERPQYILQGDLIRHGHRVEWIILDFAENAQRVNISSDSNEVPLQIANALASAYFGKSVEYDNECEITYAKQIQNLLKQLKDGSCADLDLVAMGVRSSPVDGVDLCLSHDDPAIVRRAVASLERDHSDLTANIDRIEKIKVVYSNKRIDVQFEKLNSGDDEFIVRYMDHRLNATLRKRFEDFMRDTHGIPILSTEKRFAR